jgi:hypothetical protein
LKILDAICKESSILHGMLIIYVIINSLQRRIEFTGPAKPIERRFSGVGRRSQSNAVSAVWAGEANQTPFQRCEPGEANQLFGVA